MIASLPPEQRERDAVGEVWFDSIPEAETAFDTEPITFRLAEDRKQFRGVATTFFADEVTELPPRGIADS